MDDILDTTYVIKLQWTLDYNQQTILSLLNGEFVKWSRKTEDLLICELLKQAEIFKTFKSVWKKFIEEISPQSDT